VTESYSNVNILDMDTSWKDGLAFCAIIHHFRPALIPEFDSLKAEDIFQNNDLAFRLAEEQLGIPSLLDPQDMVDSEIPDKFSIVTYVSQFYHLLKDEDNSKSPSLSMLSGKTLSSLSNSFEDQSDFSDSESPINTPKGTPKTLPKALFTSSNPILRNNKFSPSNKLSKEESGESDLGVCLTSSTHLKGRSGVTVSALSQQMAAKCSIFEER